ncbi:MAG: amino acid permease [Isosphaeraceae bacterium]|jgi:APA family basic amino acid/polyamine antiporter|nr:MAG: amino acid permease [Isosphaeraceae bacterium]
MSQAAVKPAAPPRRFGVATASFVVISSMVGTGVLTTSGYTMLAVGSNQMMLWLWVIGGVIAGCGALCVAELSAMLPESGGDYVFLREAYGPFFGFLSGWVSFLLGFGGPIASSAYGAASYLTAPLGLAEEVARGVNLGLGTAAIVGFAAIHMLGQAESARAQTAVTLIKLGVLAGLGVAGVAAGWGRWSNVLDRPEWSPGLLGAALFSLVYIAYAYTGWNAAGYIGGEVVDAKRVLPRAIGIGMGTVIGLYLVLNLFYALALGIGDVRAIAGERGQNSGALAPIAELAATRLFGPGIGGALSVAIGLTLLASLSAFVMTGGRVVYAMAAAGQFPRQAGWLDPKRQTPVVALALQAGWAIVVLWTGTFEQIFVYSSVGLSLLSMLTITAVVVLRRRRPEAERPFRVPWYPAPAVAFLVGTGLLTGAAFWQRPVESGLSLGSIVLAGPVYWLLGRGKRPSGPTV